MRLEDYEELCEMLGELRQEAVELELQIDRNLRYIREAEAHLTAFMGSEPDDVKVFSPRKTETVHRSEIGRIKSEKSVYEEQNKELEKRKNILDKRIAGFEEILDRQSRENSKNRKEEERQEICPEELDELISKIEKSSACIDRNPIQAKQDFALTVRYLRAFSDKVRAAMVRRQ